MNTLYIYIYAGVSVGVLQRIRGVSAFRVTGGSQGSNTSGLKGVLGGCLSDSGYMGIGVLGFVDIHVAT